VTTVGYIGADVPRELIEAAGMSALRLRVMRDVDTADADAILGPGVEEQSRRVFAGLVAGRYPIDLLVVSRLTDAGARTFAALRALHREGVTAFPEPLLLDLVHGPRPSSERYDREQVDELAAVLGARADALRAVIAETNESRRLAYRVLGLRRKGVLAGSGALAALGAAGSLGPAEHNDHLRRLLADPPAPPHGARRVYLCGSDHDSTELYERLESRGANVVGEDHGWGEQWFDGAVDEDREPLDALGAHYHRGFALVRRGSDHAAQLAGARADVVLLWLRRGDDGRAWGVPLLRAAAEGAGARLVVVRDAERADVEAALA
jgi:2-hydroxyglutaryl-CoA dehydratase D-component